MEIIIHRVNKLSLLKKIPFNFGLEVDLRTYKSEIILNHEPFKNGLKFSDFLENYNHQTLILNIKESGIEDLVLEQIRKFKIKKYFFLDLEFPYIYKCKIKHFKNIAIRYSELEPIENAKILKNNFKWIWIDTFTKLPVNKKNINFFKNYKTCIVCPERWGRENDIIKYINILKKISFKPSAVMTSLNYSQIWNKFS